MHPSQGDRCILVAYSRGARTWAQSLNQLRFLRPFNCSTSTSTRSPSCCLDLQVPRLRADAVSRVCRSLLECYELVYSTIEDPRSGYQEQGGVSAVKHSPAQVRTILGVI